MSYSHTYHPCNLISKCFKHLQLADRKSLLRLGKPVGKYNDAIQNLLTYELLHIICKNCFSLSYLSPAL